MVADHSPRQGVRNHGLDNLLAVTTIGAADRVFRDLGLYVGGVLNDAFAPTARFPAEFTAAVGATVEDMFFAGGNFGRHRAPGAGMTFLASGFAWALAD